MKTEKIIREPIATWWKIHSYDLKIEPLQVVAFTGSFVTFLDEWGGRKHERRESRAEIFPTFSEAKAEMVRRAAANVETAKKNLQRRRSFLGNVESLKETNPDGHVCEYHRLSCDEERRCFTCQKLMP